MTDHPTSNITHIAPPFVESSHTNVSLPLTNGNSNTEPVAEEEEEYTIKCICDYQEDDGHTVICEECQTWQHVDCYYSKGDGRPATVPDIHNCNDCEPRSLDGARAIEIQRVKRTEQLDPADRKAKKPTTKSHKKKTKASDPLAVGHSSEGHLRNGSNGVASRDHPPPAKRPKTTHRSSNSVNAQGIISSSASKRGTSASHGLQSPTKAPRNITPTGYNSESCSLEFLRLYDDDPGDAPLQANLFNDIAITSSLSLWSHDVEALAEVSPRTPGEIFMRCEQSLDSMTLPILHRETRQDDTQTHDGLHPKWTYLTIESFTPEGSIIGELRGKVGRMRDYVEDPANRWEYLRHPVPFVFFHPTLPIYIDTRREGTTCRYLRRSCRPNLTMKTILENGADYHFCFIANQNLEAGAELTIGWTLDTNIRTSLQDKSENVKQEPEQDEVRDNYVTDWAAKVLPDFGGCACSDPEGCTWLPYMSRHHSLPVDATPYVPRRGKKNRKPPHHISPSHTGNASNSRSSSEALKHQYEEDHDDTRSSSDSVRSKAQSRDMTPSDTFNDVSTAGGLEISGREKRKLADAQRRDQEEKQRIQSTQKKKKRNSGGSALNTPTTATSVCIGALQNLDLIADWNAQKQLGFPASSTLGSLYVDASTTKRESGSPISKSPITTKSPSKHALDSAKASAQSRMSARRPTYTDSSTQTDPTSDDWSDPAINASRKPFMSLTKRLLLRCHNERIKIEQEEKIRQGSSANAKEETLAAQTNGDSRIDTHQSGALQIEDGNIEMHDAGLKPRSSPVDPPLELSPPKHRPPDESEAAYSDDIPMEDVQQGSLGPPLPPSENSKPSAVIKAPSNGYRNVDLHVQLPLKGHTFTNNTVATPTATGTPTGVSALQSPTIQTPSTYPPLFSSISSSFLQGSPAKKKLSLGDYMSRRSNNNNSKVETPSLPSRTDSPSPKMAESSPTLSNTMLKPSSSLGEGLKAQPSQDNAISETSNKEAENRLAGTTFKEEQEPAKEVGRPS
ncbi:hypothetical protein MMC09_000863 [Bachmanniomyces sp. S44760]|nr:hypothetical protein [Bachmanniomyces sp. S44760]